MYEIIKNNEVKAKVWTDQNTIEPSAQQQIYKMIEFPHLYKHVAIMPDVHAGIGATVGSVIPTEGVIIPSAVGVDIGCGMCSVKTNLVTEEITERLKEINSSITRRIPRGFSHRTEGQMKDVNEFASERILDMTLKYESGSKTPIKQQLGTLGGGNHFIELQKDKDGFVWIMIHSGSRNIGLSLANKHIKKARELAVEHPIYPKDMEPLFEGTSHFSEYISDMWFAVLFALENRKVMMGCVKKSIRDIFPHVSFDDMINIPHNYVAKEEHFGSNVWVHRKGATLVSNGVTGIIPGSMGSSSYIVKGKLNPDSYFSCSHGAGRTMSRRQAKETLDMEQFKLHMEDVYSEAVDKDHLDEAPDAYKDIDKVMENQSDLVEITVKLEPILNIKG